MKYYLARVFIDYHEANAAFYSKVVTGETESQAATKFILDYHKFREDEEKSIEGGQVIETLPDLDGDMIKHGEEEYYYSFEEIEVI